MGAFNSVVFPSPPPSYNTEMYGPSLIMIPSQDEQSTSMSSFSSSKSDLVREIPALSLTYEGSNKTLIYFHGNAEDLGLSYDTLDTYRSVLKVNVLGVEYPGYGVY